MSNSENTDLLPSKLGTKEYWDSIYEREVANFEDFDDEGDVWFGQESVDKMVDWALSNVPPSSSEPSILEIGSGNGNLLFALAEAGYQASDITGIDYSADAVRLARKIGREKGGRYEDVSFEEVDFLRANPADLPRPSTSEGDAGWTLVLDKGTYDAIALAERDNEGKRPCDVYPGRIATLLNPGGFFLIISCNFTQEELLRAFERPETGLRYHSEIEYPSISFGGVKGSTYCSVAFRKTTASE